MKPESTYRDRREAGEILAARVQEKVRSPEDAVVLALPRGGLPVGLEVARSLGAQLDVFVVRKLGAPGFEEYAIGAIASGGFRVLNHDAIRELGIRDNEITAITEREIVELHRREKLYRADRPPVDVADRATLLVDDGLATGFTMRAAISAVREQRPRDLMVAVPVGAVETCAEIAREVSMVVCPFQPEPFQAVGLWYRDFSPTTDDEVRACLTAATQFHGTAQSSHRR